MKTPSNDQTKQQYARRRREAAALRSERAVAKARREQTSHDALRRYAPKASPGTAEDVASMVLHRAPRLGIEPYAGAVRRLVALDRLRVISDWSPSGKGRDTLFRSLSEHLLAKYRVPAVLWDGFFDADAEKLVPLVAHVARGGSLFHYVTASGFPVPLTRRMCHDLLASSSCGSLLRAIRRVEVEAAGGDDRLLRAWMGTREARSLGSREDEAFWWGALGWFSRAEMRDMSQLPPLVDYIGHRRREEAGFSMSGRSLHALQRGMSEWHRRLATEKVVHGVVLEPSGYAPLVLDRSSRGRDGQRRMQIWRVEEVRTGNELAAEGRRMNHCVYSYLGAIQRGTTSIWTMTLEDGNGVTGRWAMLTIEVRKDLRRVVQARGRFNRPATTEEHGILMTWAGKNGLAVSLGGW